MNYITVVEDAPSITKLLEKLLTGKGYVVEAYDTAEKGLEAMLQRPPDLLITDLRLPGMDGMELIAKVRQDLILQHIPVIMLSAHADLDTRVQGLEEADDFLGKPFHPSELYARVAALLRRRKTEGLHGALERMGGMAVVLQMLTLGYQEGVLILDDGMTATLADGHIVGLNPMVEGDDEKGTKTTAALMARQEGGFRFIPDMPMPKKSKNLHINVNEILLDAAKSIDESSNPALAETAHGDSAPAASSTATDTGQATASSRVLLEDRLKDNTKGFVTLHDFKAAKQYMASVGGIGTFKAVEAYSGKHEESCVIFESPMFVVVVLGITLCDVAASKA